MARTDSVRLLRPRLVLVFSLLVAVVAALLAAPTAPARAAVPDQWGFAYNDRPVPPVNYVMPLNRQYGSWKVAFPFDVARVNQIGLGFYEVRFPKIASRGGIAHVTAVSPEPVSCQLAKWGAAGPDELVYVRCHGFNGAPRNSAFSVMFSDSSGMSGAPYGWVWGAPGGGVVNGFNATGAPNSSTLIGPGTYDVRLPGVGGGFNGNLQVTAVQSQFGVRCKVAQWAPGVGDQRAIVRCHNGAGALVNNEFTLTYHHKVSVWGGVSPPRRFGYIWDTLGGIPPGANVNSSGALNTVIPAGPGLRLITFPQIGMDESHVQVTANGPGPEFCNLLTQWWIIGADAVVRDVACYTGFGVRMNHRSFVTYASRN